MPPKNKASTPQNSATDIFIYGDIGESWWFDDESITGKTIANQLKAIPVGTPINLRINSPGGAVDEALAIYNLLSERRDDVTTYIDGYALSAASLIALAGGRVVSPPSSIWMIHNPISLAFGNANDFRKVADVLDTHRDALLAVYVDRTGQDAADVIEALDEETWFTGAEAVEFGLATELGEELPENAKVENLIPYKFKASANNNDVEKIKELGWRFQTNRHRSNNRSRQKVAAVYQPKDDPMPPEKNEDNSELIQVKNQMTELQKQLTESQSQITAITGERDQFQAALKETIAERDQLQQTSASQEERLAKLERTQTISSEYNALRRKAEGLQQDGKLSKAQFEKMFAADPDTEIKNLVDAKDCDRQMARIEGALDAAELSQPQLKTQFESKDPIPAKPNDKDASSTPTGESVDEYAARLAKSVGRVAI